MFCRIYYVNLPGSIDRELHSIDRKSCKLFFLQNFQLSLSPLRIRVSNLLLPVYKGNPKHVFIRFSERKECASFVFMILYLKSSLIFSTGVITWRILRSGIVEVVVFSSHQRYWWSKLSSVVLESQIGEFVLLNLWVRSQSHKRGCLYCYKGQGKK